MVLSLFDYTGIMVEPWAEAGHVCICVDHQHPHYAKMPRFIEGGNIYKVNYDVWGITRYSLNWPRPDIIFSFPPCTDLAVSGARYFKAKLAANPRCQIQAAELCRSAEYLADKHNCPWMAENPVSILSTMWRKPNHWFHPWMFADLEPDDNYTKKTGVWCGNGFVMPRGLSEPLGIPDDRIHKAGPSPERANFRAATPMGFARAVFEANRREL